LSVLRPTLAIIGAMVLDSALTYVLPRHARFFDPFLLVTVYYALLRGETNGMLIGVTSGWVQDISFGGRVIGLIGFSRVIVAFLVGITARRFVIAGVISKGMTIFVATVLDAWIYESVAGLFDLHINILTLTDLLFRSGANAIVGALLFRWIDRPRRSGP
jgi:rod shape-determining protein MreD